MKIDVEVVADSPGDAPRLARRAEELGFECAWFNETKHDPFIQIAISSGATRTISLGTSIALAFTRSPTSIAYTAWDLQGLSSGRLILGLGTQVKGHIERRFGGRWESPAPKMADSVRAMKAVWESWSKGAKLDFRGRFYRLDLMTPFFSPGPIPHPRIPVYVAGVNRRMCAVAGEVAEGLHLHPLHTVEYLKRVVEPALAKGLGRAGKQRAGFAVAASVFGAVGENELEIRKVRESYRSQVAFYASTRTYRRVMETHGWGDVCDRLHELSVRGDWGRMAKEVGDDILEKFVVEGTWEEMGPMLSERYGDLVDRARLYLPFDGTPGWKALAEGFKA